MLKKPIECALQKLRHTIECTRQRGDSRLPGVRAMAAAAGVSVATMGRAVGQLAAQGEIEVVPGSGIRLGMSALQHGGERQQGGPGRHRFHAIRARVKDDILTGRCDALRGFPTMKEFCGRYGVSRLTATRILSALVDEHVLTPTGRSYTLAQQPTVAASQLTVVYFCRGRRGQDVVEPSGGSSAECLQALETMSARRNLRLDICLSRYVGSVQELDRDWEQVTARQTRREGIAGFVVERMALSAMYPSIVHTLCRLGVPVVVLDSYPPGKAEGGAAPTVGAHARVALAHYCLDREMGHDVARFAVAMGHRNIAYFHAIEGETYSDDRLDGMRVELADREAGHVHAVAANRTSAPRADFRSLLNTAESEVLSTLFSALPPEQEKAAKGLGEGYLLSAPGSNTIELLREADPALLDAVLETLALRDITLWVCANEKLGYIVYNCLRRHGVRIPRDLSLMCFDSSIQTRLLRITSYDMPVAETLSTALNAITQPELVWGRRGGGLRRIGVAGHVQQRATVRMLR